MDLDPNALISKSLQLVDLLFPPHFLVDQSFVPPLIEPLLIPTETQNLESTLVPPMALHEKNDSLPNNVLSQPYEVLNWKKEHQQ